VAPDGKENVCHRSVTCQSAKTEELHSDLDVKTLFAAPTKRRIGTMMEEFQKQWSPPGTVTYWNKEHGQRDILENRRKRFRCCACTNDAALDSSREYGVGLRRSYLYFKRRGWQYEHLAFNRRGKPGADYRRTEGSRKREVSTRAQHLSTHATEKAVIVCSRDRSTRNTPR